MTICGRRKETILSRGRKWVAGQSQGLSGPHTNSELGLALQSCPHLGQGLDLYTFPINQLLDVDGSLEGA